MVKLVDKRLKREKLIKRGSDAFQGYNFTIDTSADIVQMKDNHTTTQRREWTVRCVLQRIFDVHLYTQRQ